MDDFRNLPFVRAVIGIQSYNIGCDAIAQFIFCIYSFVRYHCNKYFIRYDWYGCSVCGRKAFSFPCGKVKGARESISVIRHAPQLANLCCDVIGDIAGIISGATTTLIVSELVAKFNLSGILPSLILTGIVSSLTIGGKAMSKGISMNNGNSIVFTVGKIMSVFKRCK